MNEDEWLAERFEAERNRLRGVAFRMLGSMNEADDAVQEFMAPGQPGGRERRREPWRVADHDRGPCLSEHAPLTQVAARGIAGRAVTGVRFRRHSEASDPEHEAVLAELGRARAPRGARNPLPRRTSRVRAPRYVRRALRRDRAHRGPNARGGAAAREPRPPAGAGIGRGPEFATSTVSARSSRRSSPLREAVTCRRCWRCSTRMSSFGWTRRLCLRAPHGSCTAPPTSHVERARSQPGRASCNWRSSTEPWAS